MFERIRAFRQALHAIEQLTPEQQAELHTAAQQGASPFIDLLTKLITDPAVLANVLNFVTALIAIFKKP